MTNPLRTLLAAVAAALLILLTGCAGPAPNYAPSIDNVESFKKSGAAPARAGTVAVTPGMKTATEIQLRANTMVSPVGRHFGDYIAAALKQELELAKLYDANAQTEVSGTLIRNDINAGGFGTNDGFIEVRFVVRRAGQVSFDKSKAITHEWPGAFAGAVAIPAAMNNYPVMVQKLIAALLADPDFVAALR